MPENSPIDWSLTGESNPFIGTNPTRTEKILTYVSSGILTAAILITDLLTPPRAASNWWRFLVLGLLALDVTGGAVANSLSAAKRYYHATPRDDESPIARLLKNAHVFTLLHVHPLIVSWLFDTPFLTAVFWYCALQVAVAAVLLAPLYLRRSVALALTVLVIIVQGAWLRFGDGWDWFVPCLFLKLVVGHAVQEEPYSAFV